MEMKNLKKVEIDYHTVCDFKSRLTGKKKYISKSDSTFHSVTIKMTTNLKSGIDDSEIEKVWAQCKMDYDAGIVKAATLGIEGEKEERHLHLAMVFHHHSLTQPTQQRYNALIEKSRVSWTRPDARGVSKNLTVVTVQPKGDRMRSFRAYRWLAYPLKNLAAGCNDIHTFKQNFNTIAWGRSYRTLGIFDGTEVDVKRKDVFTEFIFTTLEKKSNERCTTHKIALNNYLPTQVMDFKEENNIDLPWTVKYDKGQTVRNQSNLIFQMVMLKGRRRYVLVKSFFGRGEKAEEIQNELMVMHPQPNEICKEYEALLKKQIQERLKTVHQVELVKYGNQPNVLRLEKELVELMEEIEHLFEKEFSYDCLEYKFRIDALMNHILDVDKDAFQRLNNDASNSCVLAKLSFPMLKKFYHKNAIGRLQQVKYQIEYMKGRLNRAENYYYGVLRKLQDRMSKLEEGGWKRSYAEKYGKTHLLMSYDEKERLDQIEPPAKRYKKTVAEEIAEEIIVKCSE